MRIVIVGAGKSGTFLAEKLRRNHEVVLIETRGDRVRDRARPRCPTSTSCAATRASPSCSSRRASPRRTRSPPSRATTRTTSSCRGSPRRSTPKVLTFARINHPKNEWLFTEEWGVDVAVSSAVIIEQLVEHEMTLGDVVDVLRLKAEGVAMEEIVLPGERRARSTAASRSSRLPEGTHIVAVISKRTGLQIARPDTLLLAGDELLVLTDHPTPRRSATRSGSAGGASARRDEGRGAGVGAAAATRLRLRGQRCPGARSGSSNMWYGTSATITPGWKNSIRLIQNDVWSCSTLSTRSSGTNSGTITVMTWS